MALNFEDKEDVECERNHQKYYFPTSEAFFIRRTVNNVLKGSGFHQKIVNFQDNY